MKKTIMSLLTIVLLSSVVHAQKTYEGTIRGRVIEKQTEAPIPYANIVVEGEGNRGAVSDDLGYYEIPNVPLGRVTLKISCIGYKNISITNQELLGGKDLMVNIELTEDIEELQEIVITSGADKTLLNNEDIQVSGRTFSIEESMRYAGSNNDIARMATNFAGVQQSNDALNDIVIRGNSPNGLLWRMENVDIPNPNHFGRGGSTGGPISLLNNNVLANSDFLTGAFPSEYGNALSGVFDLKLRNGNDQTYEGLAQIGLNGFELMAEGPLNREKHSSFIVNGRYNTMKVMSMLGFDAGTGTAVPNYYDAYFNANLPTQKVGTFKVFGLMGVSGIEFINSNKNPDKTDDNNSYTFNDRDVYSYTNMHVVGLSNKYNFSNRAYGNLTLSYSYYNNSDDLDTLIDFDTKEPHPYYRGDLTREKLSLSYYVKSKIGAANYLKTGVYVNHMMVDFKAKLWEPGTDDWQTSMDLVEGSQLYQLYANYHHQFSYRLESVVGLSSQIAGINGKSTLEPRFSLRYKTGEQSSINFGYGLHSQLPQLELYAMTVETNQGDVRPNMDLDFMKSHHFILGYDKYFNANFRFKAEAYYQSLYDAVTGRNASDFDGVYCSINDGSFSAVNVGFPDSLVNYGTGHNYGIDLTLEKFLDKGYYFLATASVFDSKYTAYDGQERNTAFNSKFSVNLLGGKDWEINQSNKVTFDAKVVYSGGQWFIPLDELKSIDTNYPQYKIDEAYDHQLENYFRMDIRIGYKMIKNKFTSEWALDIQNVTNYQNLQQLMYNNETGGIEKIYQLGFYPMFLYRMVF